MKLAANPKEIKLVVFDGEGVIYDSRKVMQVFLRRYRAFLKKFNISFKQQEKLWFQLYPKTVRGKLKLKEANALVYKKLGIPKKYVREWLHTDLSINLKYVKLYPGIKAFMRKLKAKGIKVAVLSDTVHPLAWRLKLFKKLGLVKGKHYDKVFLSNQIGFEKPEANAYLAVLKHFDVKPEEAVFIGHDRAEIEGAKEVGMKTVKLIGGKVENLWEKVTSL